MQIADLDRGRGGLRPYVIGQPCECDCNDHSLVKENPSGNVVAYCYVQASFLSSQTISYALGKMRGTCIPSAFHVRSQRATECWKH